MKKTFKSLLILFFLMMTASVFADDWYICLGSFKEKINAQNREQILNQKDIPSFVIEHTSKKGEKLFRVLLDEAISTEKAAEKRKVQLEKQLKEKGLGIQSLWYYQPYKSSLKKRVEPLKTTPKVTTPKKAETKKEEPKTDVKIENKPVVDKPETKAEPVSNQNETTEPKIEPVSNPKETIEPKVEKSEEKVSEITENKNELVVLENTEPVINDSESSETTETIVDDSLSVEPVFNENTIAEDSEIIKETEEEKENVVEELDEGKSIEEDLSTKEFPYNPVDFTKQIANLKKESKESEKEQIVPAKRSLMIKDSVTGYPVSEANVRIDEKWDTETNDVGMAPIPDEVPDGEHTILVTKEGEYVPTASNFSLTNGEVSSIAQISIPKLVDYERIQIILDWGEYPWDIDSHIIDNEYHVYFSNRDVPGKLNLDRDDTNSYGPETITIYSPQPDRKYEYYVFNYTNQEFDGDTLSYSNARVRVILNNTQVGEFKITPGIKGRTWHVFDIENGSEIKVYDSLINWEPRSSVSYYDEFENDSFNWRVDHSEENEDEAKVESSDTSVETAENISENAKEEVKEETTETVTVDETSVEPEKEKFFPEGNPIDVPAKNPYLEKPEDLIKVYGSLE